MWDWKILCSFVCSTVLNYKTLLYFIVPAHVRESNTVLGDSGFHTVVSGFQVLDSSVFPVELGFRILIVGVIVDSTLWSPDSSLCQRSEEHTSELQSPT